MGVPDQRSMETQRTFGGLAVRGQRNPNRAHLMTLGCSWGTSYCPSHPRFLRNPPCWARVESTLLLHLSSGFYDLQGWLVPAAGRDLGVQPFYVANEAPKGEATCRKPEAGPYSFSFTRGCSADFQPLRGMVHLPAWILCLEH